MKVVLRNPRREVEIPGPLKVQALLRRLDLNPESVLVIRGDVLATHDELLDDLDTIEIRPVISGGAGTHEHECECEPDAPGRPVATATP